MCENRLRTSKNSALPIAWLPASVSNRDYPNVIGPVNIEQGEGKLFQPDSLHAWQVGHGRVAFRVGSDGGASTFP
jgi:hypothetical protein